MPAVLAISWCLRRGNACRAVLSSKNESKVEERLAGRIDLLAERLDTLASTVATTASAMAKKDGEIATLRRDLQLRDEQIQALAARTQATAGADPRELNELRQTVAALANERAKQAGSKQIDQLTAKVAQLGQRLETVSSTVSTTAAGLAGRDGEIAAIRKYLGRRTRRQRAPPRTPSSSASSRARHRLVSRRPDSTARRRSSRPSRRTPRSRMHMRTSCGRC